MLGPETMGTLLSPADRQALVNSVATHEGFRAKPYTDTVGKLTIGYGRNLTNVGISRKEAAFLLANDLDAAEQSCRDAFDWFDQLSPARQRVLIEMAFNLGFRKLLGFGQTLKACQEGRYADAAARMLTSRWAQQVGQRAVTLAEQMRVG